MATKKRSTVRKSVRKSLIEQLKRRGSDIALFEDQIEDYMAQWDRASSKDDSKCRERKEDMSQVLPRMITRESTCLTESRKMYGKRAWQESGKSPKDNRVRLNRKDK